ncbi:MAG: hypothetical protein JNK75_13485 [Betaproteobacteria bacterium]|nr:hypothetical protein [Betaproteobacteria bacterium]
MGKRYKLQVQDDDTHPERWRDVKDTSSGLLTFEKEEDGRAKLAELFPVLVKLEQFAAGPKRTRVVVVNPYEDIDEEREQ